MREGDDRRREEGRRGFLGWVKRFLMHSALGRAHAPPGLASGLHAASTYMHTSPAPCYCSIFVEIRSKSSPPTLTGRTGSGIAIPSSQLMNRWSLVDATFLLPHPYSTVAPTLC
jgi:hypothetical protein